MQLVRCPTHIAGNRLVLVMAYVPDIIGVSVGIPLKIFDHCFVSFRVEHSVLEFNIRSTVLLKHSTNWDNVCCAVRSFTWSTILMSADPLDSLSRAIGEVIGRLVSTTVLCNRSGDMQWFDASCRELMMLSRLLIMPGV